MTVKMTRICLSCSHEYGTFRPRCPTCGSPAPTCKHGMTEGLCAVCTGKVRAINQKGMKGELRGKPRKEKKQGPTCVLCLCRAKVGTKKVVTCPHCNELVHVRCQRYHDGPCQIFQRERQTIINAVSNVRVHAETKLKT